MKRTHALVAIIAVVFALIALTKSINAHPTIPDVCDELFEQRNDLDKAKEALECFEGAVKAPEGDPTQARRMQEGFFRSVLWLSTQLESDAEKIPYLTRGLTVTSGVIEKAPNDAIGYFWDALFTGLYCQILDKGKLFPSCLVGSKREVVAYLENTRKLELPLEGAGGSRILGTLLTRMPKIIGGNKKRGEELLTEALTEAPDYSANFVELGRFLVAQKRQDEAAKILNAFINLNCLTMNPNRALECGVDQLEAKRLLGL